MTQIVKYKFFTWQIDPIGLRLALINLYDRYQKPFLLVSEIAAFWSKDS
ncbi:hypothetical protein [Lactobacillus panisapium]|nr:hypothetical protein [Lactobacillus panisapium]